MTLKEFNIIENHLINEYAGYFDKKELITQFPSKISNISEEEFYFHMTKYLNKFHDPHLKLIELNGLYPNIRVQLHNDQLYVIDSRNPQIPTGSVIHNLGSYSIKYILENDHDLLKSSNPERMEWSEVLKKYKYIVSDSKEISILQKDKPDFFEQSYIIENKHTYIYLKFTDFIDHLKISNLIDKHKKLLLNAKQIIIDVRGNRGGSDLAYLKLLPYLTSESITITDDTPYYHRFTKAYCDERIHAISELIKQMPDSDDLDEYKSILNLYKDNYDKGLVNINNNPEPDTIKGIQEKCPDVKVLSDFECGSSGDNFVKFAHEFKNIEIIGRPTKGMNDYSNVMFVDIHGKYKLSVPHSKDGNVDLGKSMGKTGIPVDHYIPWTPEELEKDIILETAINRFTSL
ncbi:S41 family peptidase [Mammaliicoccus sciuri]|uniref:S41 family peptidase n=1 Tax=Mammaliicoccus sciuri TaxID=1296 RepID=UPI0022721102|nr:S41 family peptidase [Mammaliicoccus sciuri]MCY1027776.1 S41 family peptidase [Mammaliicoccus sciuri]